MTLTWVICGAGRHVGKTRLAQRLCEVLPNAVYAKQGCSARKAGKPANFFRTNAELAAFLEASRATHDHIVVESNELARAGAGDVIIFVEGVPGRTDYRADADLLRSKSHLHVRSGAPVSDWPLTRANGPGPSIASRLVPRRGTARVKGWTAVLQAKLGAAALREAVCNVLAEHASSSEQPGSIVRRVEPLRISTKGAPSVHDQCDVVVEELLTIMVEGLGSFAIMCTPCEVEALAVGFAFSEGMISSVDEIIDCSYRADQKTIALRLDASTRDGPNRNLIVTSSCGLCGSRNIDRLLAGHVASGDSMRVQPPVLRRVVKDMHARQVLFKRTGGTHAAAVFEADGSLIAMGEDIGRHNALDKAVGKCLLQHRVLAGRGAVLSGRVSLELVAKAARAGLEMVVAVSAPSSLAIQVAERCNITLCGFARGDRATVYTHPRRIAGLLA
jgi:FdhD protein